MSASIRSRRQPQDYARLFDLAPSHSLKLSSQQQVTRDSTVFETRWLDEHDAAQKLVARYRTWSNHGLNPPYRQQLGWERYSLTGELLDREVRYARRDDNEFVH